MAAEFDRAGLHEASAHAAMAAAAIEEAGRRCGPGDLRTDVELDFDLDEHGRVWMYREGHATIIGRRNAACAEMGRFLVSVVLGDCPPD
jgi:hypothetical protein